MNDELSNLAPARPSLLANPDQAVYMHTAESRPYVTDEPTDAEICPGPLASSKRLTMTPLDIAREAAAAAADKKAVRPLLLDLRGVSDMCDFQFICSGENERQTRAIADAIEDRCRALGNIRPSAIEGKQTGNWIVLDYGSTLVHVFYNYLRDYYGLEQLWPKAKPVKI